MSTPTLTGSIPSRRKCNSDTGQARWLVPIGSLILALALACAGCVSTPRNAAHPGGREFLLGVAGQLQRHGFEVQNVQEGVAADRSFLEFVAANATLTVGVTAADANKPVADRCRDFKELIDTISGLAAHGLEVRDFLFYPAEPHVVEFCDGKLTMRPPRPMAPRTAAQVPGPAATTGSGVKPSDKQTP